MTAPAYLTLSDFYGEIRKKIKEAGSQRAFAEAHCLSDSYVSDVLNARCDPGDKILATLGWVKRTVYLPKPQPKEPPHGP
jgi:hypothetical protein